MSFDLQKLVDELEIVFVERGVLLDAPVQEAFQARIDCLKRAIDEADAAEVKRLRFEGLRVLADLLSVVTNVMSLLG